MTSLHTSHHLHNSYVHNLLVEKPYALSPGSQVITQTTITQTAPQPLPVKLYKGYEIFSSIFGVAAAIGMWLGSVLIITAMALVLRDAFGYYTQVGGLLIAGFSLWFIASLLNWVPNFGGFSKGSSINGQRSGYHIAGIAANLVAALSFALFIIGAACWLSVNGNPRYAGEILWILAAGLWLISVFIRDMGLRYDAICTYRHSIVLPTTLSNTTEGTTTTKANRPELAAHLTSVWSNAITTDLYLIAATLFVLGAIMFAVRGRTADQSLYASGQAQVAAAVLWMVGACFVFFGAISHCIARR